MKNYLIDFLVVVGLVAVSVAVAYGFNRVMLTLFYF